MNEVSAAPKSSVPSVKSAVVILLLTALDTTWRMFLPVLGGLFAGLGLDSLFHKAPLFTIICLVLGVALSAWLVALQLRRTGRSK